MDPEVRRGLDRVLARVRRALLRQDLTCWAADTLTGAGVVWLAILLGPWPPSEPRYIGLGLTLLVAAVAFGLDVVRPAIARRSDVSLAFLVEERLAELRSRLAGAVELSGLLSRAGTMPGFSEELALAAVRSAVDIAGRADLTRVVDRSRFTRLRAKLLAGLAVAMALVVPLRWDRLHGMIVGPEPRQGPPVREPLVGDLTVALRFPGYLGMEPRRIDGSDGTLRVPVGTEIRLEARLLVPAEEVSMVLDTGTVERLKAGDGDGLSVSFVAQASGTYRFEVLTHGGETLVDPRPRRLTVIPDRHPEITMVEPSSDLELDPRDDLPLTYEARDDHGVSRVELVVERPGEPEPHRLVLMEDQASPPKQTQGSSVLHLESLDLEPGDRVVIYLEATDDDTVTGPKSATSARRTVSILSMGQRHDAAMAKAREAWEAMIRLLATRLELGEVDLAKGWDEHEDQVQAALAETAGVLQRVAELLEVLSKDTMVSSDVVIAFTSFHKRMERLFKLDEALVTGVARWPKPAQVARFQASGARAVEILERAILTIDRLMDRQQVEDLELLGKELARAQERLRDLLLRYREHPDPALRREIERQIRRMRQRIADLMRRLASQMKKLPFEHVNQDALADKSIGRHALEFQRQMQALEERLQAGDLEGAMEELERFTNQLQRMLGALDRDAREQRNDGIDTTRAEMEALLQEVKEIEQVQRALEQETASLQKDLERERMEKLEGELEGAMEEIRREVEVLRADLDQVDRMAVPDSALDPFNQSRQLARHMEAALDDEDLGSMQEISRDLERATDQASRYFDLFAPRGGPREARVGRSARRLRDARERAARIRERLDRLAASTPRPSRVMEQKRRGLASRQQELAQRTRRALERLQGISGAQELESGEATDGLSKARREMTEAGGKLREARLRGARSSQQVALQKLSQAGKALEAAVRPKRGGMAQGVGSSGASGRPDTGEVEIPKASDYKSPEAFRRELLEAMKQAAPEGFEEQVRRYYRELVR